MSEAETHTRVPEGETPHSENGRPRVDVIIRTLALEARERELLRALDGIQNQSWLTARPIVVVNGERFHPPLVEALRQRPGVLFHYEREASAGHALAVGRTLVTAPHFMFLDDDDELVEHGLQRLARHLADNPDWDVLITNGYFSSNADLRPMYLDLATHAVHPLRSLLAECWLFPGASIFRTESISAQFLDVKRDYHEWTYIAFLLAVEGKRISFLDVATVTYYDTQESASKSFEYEEAALDLLDIMKADRRLDNKTLAIMERKYRNVLHTLASRCWRRGARRKAWHYHLRSMRPPFTFQYLLFSRKLLIPTRRR
jgi:hypothetical protein